MTELDAPYALRPEQIEDYRRDGYLRLRDVLSAPTLEEYGAELTRVVRDTPPSRRMSSRHVSLLSDETLRRLRKMMKREPRRSDDTYARAFTQRTNLWELSPKVERFVRSRRLARLANELMGTQGVRLYHDQALYKEARGGHTPWHCDQFYWPLSNANTITAWIPLQPVPQEMGPLAFARRSHRIEDEQARALAISDESEEKIGKLLAGCEVDDAPFELGEVSFHAGWTFHRAEPNLTDRTRAAFTIIYMDRDIRATEPKSEPQAFDLGIWLPGVAPGEPAASPVNPVLYELP